jgi:hypothetical protein
MADLAGQFERDMRALVADILGAPQPDELPDECAAWVDATIAVVSPRVLGSTYLVLLRELDRALSGAPPGVVRSLELSRARVDIGVE